MSEQIETKDCPYCGEQINAKAIKCKHCQSMLNSNESKATKECPSCAEVVNASDTKCVHCQSDLTGQPPIVAQVSVDKGAKLEAIVAEHQKKHRLAHPLPQKDQPKQGGIMGFIKKTIMKGPSEVAFLDEITYEVLNKHSKYTSEFRGPPQNPQNEKPLYVVNTTCFQPGTGVVLTRRNLYYSVRPAKSLMMGMGSNIVGRVPIQDIQAISIGSSDTALGNAYIGHDFFLSGQKIGWLRMGRRIQWDDEVLERTTDLFVELTAVVFSVR